jgi:hypothetical protein
MTAQQVPQRAQRLYSLWRQLPDTPLTEEAFINAILKALDHGPGQEADASAYRHSLVGCEAVRAAANGSGEVVYQRMPEFPTWPENGPGTPAYDQQIREMAQEEQAAHDRAAAEVERNSPQNQARLELDAHIRQVVREDPVVRQVLVALVREVLAAR